MIDFRQHNGRSEEITIFL